MMRKMQERSDDEIDDFLRSLPPAPESWVARAEELPQLERALSALPPESADRDVASLRAALQSVGLEPDDRRVRALSRLRELREEH
jgi:hypothetical protein